MYDSKKIDVIKNWLGTGSVNIFGKPFSGKDTQARRLSELIDGNTVGGGEILRNSTIPKHVEDLIRNGKLAPTEDYVKIVLPYLSQDILTGKPLILSSLGRWSGEEEAVIKALDKSGHELKAVVYLDISDTESKNRWLVRDTNNDRIGRHDDTLEVLETRFAEFASKTQPVLKYYKKHDLLITINGKGDRQLIEQDILDNLYDFASAI
ncbi:AAA family ATPase [Candidatus Saccharibacteria bacterium]|nr:AAA family ATPase [Candidatus Saccharibacteria bacterium]